MGVVVRRQSALRRRWLIDRFTTPRYGPGASGWSSARTHRAEDQNKARYGVPQAWGGIVGWTEVLVSPYGVRSPAGEWSGELQSSGNEAGVLLIRVRTESTNPPEPSERQVVQKEANTSLSK